MPAGLSIEEFDEKYIEACFYAWYKAGCPALQTHAGTTPVGGSRIVRVLPTTADGRRPNIHTVRRWMDKYAWLERADALDAQVSLKLDKSVIEQRIKDLKKISQTGETLLDKGMEFINEGKPFADNASAAVRAVISGAEMMFRFGGAADRLEAISQMSDKQLESELARLLGKESDNENENSDIVDTTSEDVPSEDEESESNNS